MILKFCYQNEIHRSSDAPAEYGHLRVFLKSMFREALPKNYSLSYLTNEGQSIALKTEQDYEGLKALAASKAVKVVITAEEGEPQIEEAVPEQKPVQMDVSDYEVIGHPLEEEPIKQEPVEAIKEEPVEELIKEVAAPRVEPVEERKIEVVDVLSKVSEELTQAYVLPMLQTYGENLPETSLISTIFQEKLRAHMPILLAQVRETVLKQQSGVESQKISYPKLDGPNVQGEEQVIYQGQAGEEKNDLVGKVLKVINDLPDVALRALNDLPDKASKAFNDLPENASKAFNEFPEKASKAFNEFPEKASKALNEFPEKAANFVDNVAHQISGNPYVEVLEGRYPKNIVERANQLQEFFPESDKKELLDFVTKFPKEISLDEIAHHYANTKGM
jgi:ElaB/YqjD/DUF883 family membrane-anchored ribosome-binding protein